ncbi:lactonase drp35 [Fusarium pseudocircinatum]|uniref:Lactonase drp35 n=1 Tax=Fusarium pseudocircinatum TaxID=56676 RepID=A0A8H5P2Z5_9HYPO|nr:lactonase drp35 [Fusarium pseudocircinatum]
MNWFAPPPVLEPKLLTTLPSKFRTVGVSEHSTNQKRGRPLDSFLEGPVVIDDTLYLADIPYGRIFAVNLDTKEWDLVVQYDGEPNGLAWHKQRRQLLIADFKHGILALDLETKTMTTVMDRFNGERLKGPNDLIVTCDGSIIFTDQGMSGLQDPTGRVYRISSDFNTGSGPSRVEVLLRNCPSPNGLVLDKDEKNLFVAMTRDNSVWLAPLYPDGSVQRTGRFSSYFGVGGPDGLLTNREGDLFVAHSTLGMVFVHHKDGTPRAAVTTKGVGSGTTNLTWGEGAEKTLYIVESESGTILTLDWCNAATVQ